MSAVSERIGSQSGSLAATSTRSGVPGSTITVSGAPTVSAPETVIVEPGTPLRVDVAASDPDCDPIRSLTADISALSSAPNHAAFTASFDHTRGTLLWTP